jgi:hypothetical protein
VTQTPRASQTEGQKQGKQAEGAPATKEENRRGATNERGANGGQTEPRNRAEGAAAPNQSGANAEPGTNGMQPERSANAPARQSATTRQDQQAGTNQGKPATQQMHATGKARINDQSASRIADTLMASAQPQSLNVNLNVGTVLPAAVALAPLPPNVVQLVPEYQGYDYVVANDEIVIVQPETRNVVEVISGGPAYPAGAGQQAMAGTRVNPCGP